MRKLVGLATALLGLLAFVAIATANTAGPSPLGQTQQLDVTHSPNKAGKGTKVIVDLHVRCDPAKVCQPPAGGLVAGPAGKASPVVNTVVHLPTGMKTGYKDFPKCNPSKLEANGLGGCSKKAIVGKGNLTADGRPTAGTVPGTVTAFNGVNKGYLLYVVPEISSPLVLKGHLSGSTLTIPVPLVPTIGTNPNATLTDFKITTGGKTKKKKHGKKVTVNYLTNPKKCPSGGYVWKFDFKYENGESLSPTDAAPCKK